MQPDGHFTKSTGNFIKGRDPQESDLTPLSGSLRFNVFLIKRDLCFSSLIFSAFIKSLLSLLWMNVHVYVPARVWFEMLHAYCKISAANIIGLRNCFPWVNMTLIQNKWFCQSTQVSEPKRQPHEYQDAISHHVVQIITKDEQLEYELDFHCRPNDFLNFPGYFI